LFAEDDEIEKRQQLVGFIIADVNFSQKVNILIKILKAYYPKVEEKYPTLYKDFEKVRKLRNRLAHSQLDTSLDYLKLKPKKIRLEVYENGKKEHYELTEELIKQKIRDVFNLFVQLTEIMVAISGKKDFSLRDKP
jgi:hypothetical protein